MRKNNIIAVNICLFIGLLGLAACTPGDVKYCSQFGVEGTAEYGKCVSYYNEQEAAFRADREVCEFQADATYPPSLYDFGHDEHVVGGYGPYGRWHSGTMIHMGPDYRHNAQVDALRMRIIGPCMQSKGWNSAKSWQAGRHPVTPLPKKSVPATKLPWK